MKLHLPDTSARYLVGVSGGPDSVTLLRAMQQAGCACVAAHCNFALRGRESDGDETFVKTLCSRLGIECLSVRFDTIGYAHGKGISIEMAARELRYDWFERMRVEHHCDYIAVAHNLNDQVETFFLNLARGTGLKGLCGMDWINGHVVRPLLHVTRDEILAYSADYRTDSTNSDVSYRRNRVRHRIVPEMVEMNPSFLKTMESNIENLRAAQSLIDDRCSGTSSLSRMEELYMELHGYGFNRRQICQICRAELSPESGQRFTSGSAEVVINRGKAILYPKSATSFPESQLSVVESPTTFELTVGEAKAQISKSKVRGRLVLRHWHPGERFQPSGMDGKSKKISDFLTGLKMDVMQKQKQLIVVDKTPDGERVVWVVGKRVDERYLV